MCCIDVFETYLQSALEHLVLHLNWSRVWKVLPYYVSDQEWGSVQDMLQNLLWFQQYFICKIIINVLFALFVAWPNMEYSFVLTWWMKHLLFNSTNIYWIHETVVLSFHFGMLLIFIVCLVPLSTVILYKVRKSVSCVTILSAHP